MSLVDEIEHLNREIGTTLERALSALRRELRDHLRDSHQDLERRIEAFAPAVPASLLAPEDLAPAAERLRAEARTAGFDELREALAALDRARSQSAVLAALLAGAGHFASRAALLLWRAGELRGWGGRGFADSEHALRGLTLAPAADSGWLKVVGAAQEAGPGSGNGASGPVQLSAAECAELCGRIESPLPAFGLLVPLVLRDRVVAVLYADQLEPAREAGEAAGAGETAEPGGAAEAAGAASAAGAAALSRPALQSLVYVAALAIESLPFRQRDSTATLAATAEAAAGQAAPATPGGAPAIAAVAPAEASAAPAAVPTTQPPSTPSRAPESAPSAAPAVRPAALYDAPAVPVVKETAEIPAPRPLRATTPNPARPAVAPAAGAAAAASSETAWIAHPAGSPYLEEQAATEVAAEPAAVAAGPEAPAAPAEPAAGEHETVLLPHAALRESGASPWARKVADQAKAVAMPGIAEGAPTGAAAPAAATPPAAAFPPGLAAAGEPEIVAEPELEAAAEAPSPASPAAPLPATPSAPSSAPSAPSPGPLPVPGAGPGNLRAVPPLAAAAAGPGAAAGGATAPLPPPLAPSLEALRTGPIGSGTPEVRPPTGVQGPGWAFSTTRVQATSSEEAVHEEARRLARLLVSEIKLYNEEQVEAGRRNRDIYERLREDIDRSRQMYEERVEPRLVKSTDYFYQELVRILAAGDSKALGI
jgi:hypothetical protein